MAYRNKTYVCFDADTDIHYYRLMQAWKTNSNQSFNFHDAHALNTLTNRASEEQVKRKLRQRFTNTKTLIVLVGSQTRYLYRFVRWEMEVALRLGIPIIAVNLNGKRSRDDALCPPILREQLGMHVAFRLRIIEYAMDNWPSQYRELANQGESGSYYYKSSTYTSLGIKDEER